MPGECHLHIKTTPRGAETTYGNQMKLDNYVGKLVRLNQRPFDEIKIRAKRPSDMLENRFLVAEVSRGVHKLICYGANLRIVVGEADVVVI